MENNIIGIKTSEDRYNFRDLEWDTEYFEKKSCRIDIQENINYKDIVGIENIINEYEFVTITNSKGNSFNNYYIGNSLKAFLTDVNVQLRKSVVATSIAKYEQNIEVINNKQYDEQLLNLVNGIFKNSRFLNDKNIKVEKANGMYKKWVENSFNKADKYFITYKLKGELIAFILFSPKNSQELTIELICVNDEFTGNGLGKKLMKKLDYYAIENGYSIINVGTQIENINALNFYIAFGYRISDIRYIYHLWNKKNDSYINP
ncbi:GNAT family N-acetyltransferase [Clostridium sp.]|uniref:GNAT family N-acetyltransferase n=1 Tax=Clostridium sp. TaxID=1506 RepID=UPI002914EE21|nr:GNAT family N-acetyltransferase [Clostridium sp.]MDU4738660.1 GNAT family N-acetyltransferase [Clostridium sp.]